VPKLQQLADRYAGRIGVVGFTQLTRTSTREGTQQFLAEKGVTYPVGVVERPYADAYGVSGIPAAALIKEGRVLWRGHPAAIDDALMEHFLAKPVDDSELAALAEIMPLLKGMMAENTRSEPKDDVEASALYRDAMSAYREGRFTEAKQALDKLIEAHPDTAVARSAARTLKEVSVVGTPVASLDAVRWVQGEAPDPSDTALMVFFESWCPHCRREVPRVQQQLTEYAADGVKVVGLTNMSRGSSDADLDDFIRDAEVTFPVGKDARLPSDAYAVTGVPAAVVVRDGVVVWRGHPASLSPSKVRQILAR